MKRIEDPQEASWRNSESALRVSKASLWVAILAAAFTGGNLYCTQVHRHHDLSVSIGAPRWDGIKIYVDITASNQGNKPETILDTRLQFPLRHGLNKDYRFTPRAVLAPFTIQPNESELRRLVQDIPSGYDWTNDLSQAGIDILENVDSIGVAVEVVTLGKQNVPVSSRAEVGVLVFDREHIIRLNPRPVADDGLSQVGSLMVMDLSVSKKAALKPVDYHEIIQSGRVD